MFLFLFILSQLSAICGEGNGNPLQCSCLEEPGGLLSVGLHRVRHDWSALACMHALEKEMATHSSILAWRIPGTEEPGGLPSMGSHRVGHDWSDYAAAASAIWGLPWWLRLWRICLQYRRPRSIPGLGRSPGGENGKPLWYSFLENAMDKRAWWATVPWTIKSWSCEKLGRKKLDMTE